MPNIDIEPDRNNKGKYTHKFALQIYLNFSKTSARGQAVLEKIYNFSSDYIINLIKHKKFVRWYRFKRCVKIVEEEIRARTIKGLDIDWNYGEYKRLVEKDYPLVERKSTKQALSGKEKTVYDPYTEHT